jgi:hypothetical protein
MMIGEPIAFSRTFASIIFYTRIWHNQLLSINNVKEKPFYFEIKDMVTQFVSAFDDVVISRYNKHREEQNQINVRYMYAPKQRVIYDLTNKNKHITLPAIAVNITSVSRDPDRVFNKIYGQPHFRVDMLDGNEIKNKSDHLRSPVPVNIGISMSILTKYQSDMDQILSNFIPYSNPYIVISWKLPDNLIQQAQEIRSPVIWDGNINVTYPTELPATTPYRVSADTSFTIKGWLFKYQSDQEGIIYTVKTNFTPLIDIDES